MYYVKKVPIPEIPCVAIAAAEILTFNFYCLHKSIYLPIEQTCSFLFLKTRHVKKESYEYAWGKFSVSHSISTKINLKLICK